MNTTKKTFTLVKTITCHTWSSSFTHHSPVLNLLSILVSLLSSTPHNERRHWIYPSQWTAALNLPITMNGSIESTPHNERQHWIILSFYNRRTDLSHSPHFLLLMHPTVFFASCSFLPLTMHPNVFFALVFISSCLYTAYTYIRYLYIYGLFSWRNETWFFQWEGFVKDLTRWFTHLFYHTHTYCNHALIPHFFPVWFSPLLREIPDICFEPMGHPPCYFCRDETRHSL